MECKTAQEALDLLRYCLQNGGIVLTRHFRTRLQERGIALEDALQVMRSGAIYRPAEVDLRRGHQKWTVEGRCPEGEWICVVFRLETVERGFLITVFGEGG